MKDLGPLSRLKILILSGVEGWELRPWSFETGMILLIRSGLASAVRTEEPEDLTRFDRVADVLDCGVLAV